MHTIFQFENLRRLKGKKWNTMRAEFDEFIFYTTTNISLMRV